MSNDVDLYFTPTKGCLAKEAVSMVTVKVDELEDFSQPKTLAVYSALRNLGAIGPGTIDIDELKEYARRWIGPTVQIPAELMEGK